MLCKYAGSVCRAHGRNRWEHSVGPGRDQHRVRSTHRSAFVPAAISAFLQCPTAPEKRRPLSQPHTPTEAPRPVMDDRRHPKSRLGMLPVPVKQCGECKEDMAAKCGEACSPTLSQAASPTTWPAASCFSQFTYSPLCRPSQGCNRSRLPAIIIVSKSLLFEAARGRCTACKQIFVQALSS